MPMYLPIVLAVAMHVSPAADTVPKLDVARECRAEVYDQQAQKACVDEENQTRQELAKEWSSFDAADRRLCGQEAEMGGASSYAEFLTCLEMARDTRKSQNAMNQDTQTQGGQTQGKPKPRK